ncbi:MULTISPECIES: tetratricopeptide repeat protein [Paenibacillus]|uniref:Tetratricopeptide repeat protein n=1 Tax=Paenibacillus whitsoniae TaxID=2496558 RepID=A0A430JHE4_9BACL|nr:tetratricopeptide repeat protein [Paenibacillus whitsoniae]RTE10422.1 tetratricopeptide repeat protein [Paenibacillus whitsoniae]
MFKHLFSTMNEVLEEIQREYPNSDVEKKAELDEQLQVLKTMSDEFIESWLLFEEKLGKFYGAVPSSTQTLHDELMDLDLAGKQTEEFLRGQGFYKLSMYDQAIEEFEVLIRRQPDFLLARIYLAMGHLRKGEFGDAYQHFKFLLPLTENAKMKAISYGAMGCIQVQNHNMEKAFEYFQKAYHSDPSLVEPLINLDESQA